MRSTNMQFQKFFPIFFFFSFLWAQEATDLNSALLEIKNKHDVVGMSVLVIQQGKICFSGDYGLKDVGRNLPVDANTQYRVASVSKMIVATAIMQLYELGHFQLDEDVSRYLNFSLHNPHFPNQKITFQSLLSHTSSLRDGDGYSDFLKATHSQVPFPLLSDLLLPSRPFYTADMFDAEHSPDQRYFQYANVNFVVLGTLIESLSKKRFDQYCRDHIFQPLGMNASFRVRDLKNINDLAVLYRKKEGQWVSQCDNHSGIYPAEPDLNQYILGTNAALFAPQGGMRASSQDLAKFLLQFYSNCENSILKPETIAKMHSIVWEYNGNNGDNHQGIFNTYCLGNHQTKDLIPKEILQGHPGEAYGLVSDVYFCKEKNYGIIFITNGAIYKNGSQSGWYKVEEEIFQACYEKCISAEKITKKE